MPIVLRCLVYVMMTALVELAKEFKDVGTATLRTYDYFDWLVLFVCVGSLVAININAFFSTAFADHRDSLKSNGKSNDTNSWNKQESAGNSNSTNISSSPTSTQSAQATSNK